MPPPPVHRLAVAAVVTPFSALSAPADLLRLAMAAAEVARLHALRATLAMAAAAARASS